VNAHNIVLCNAQKVNSLKVSPTETLFNLVWHNTCTYIIWRHFEI